MPALVKRTYRPRRITAPYRRRRVSAYRTPLYRSPRPAPRRRTIGSRSYAQNTDAMKSVSSNAGANIGGAIGSLFGPAGSALGSLLGHGAQSLVKMVTGFGDYNVNRNSLMPGALEPPMIVNQLTGKGIVVRHREYIADITSSIIFTTQQYAINAGLVGTFPWLSQIAESFEEYCIHGMLFEFKSMSSDAVLSTAANSALGTVIMATQYNALNPGFVDKREMENYEFSNSAKPSESFIHPIECKGTETPVKCLYVRIGSVPTNADQRLYDLGVFTIATQGMQSAVGTIGELWVTFEIEFFKPKLISGLGLQVLTDHYRLVGVTNAFPLGSLDRAPEKGSQIGTEIFITGSGATQVFFPFEIVDGTYLVEYSVQGTATAVTSPTFTPLPNLTFAPPLYQNDTNASQFIRTGTVTSVYWQSSLVTISGPQAGFTIGIGVLPTAVTAGDLWITQINSGISA